MADQLMSGAPDGPNAFDYLEGPIATDPGTLADYEASLSEYLGASFGYAMDLNPAQLIAREADFLAADFQALAGATGWVDPETAKKEIAEAKLNLTVPEGGISRFELNTLKYLKQQEIARQSTFSRRSGPLTSVLGFGAGLAASATDPLNVASAFLPVVPELRYAQWLAAANSASARAAIRAGVGAVEGAAGAALIEPFVYAGATSQQFDYSAIDSFMNVAFGTALGGGLHTGGGAAFDYFNASTMKALKGLDEGIVGKLSLLQRAAEDAPESVKMEALHVMTRALEDDVPGDVAPLFEATVTTERVKAAAVKFRGKIFTGATHADAMDAIGKSEAEIDELYANGEIDTDGFVTTSGRYVDRMEAGRIALAHDQFKAELDVNANRGFYEANPPDALMLNFERTDAARAAKIGDVGASEPKPIPGDRDALLQEASRIEAAIAKAPQKKAAPLVARYREIMAALNAQALPTQKVPPRDLSGLIQQSRADRTQEAFNRQFVDEQPIIQAADKAAAESASEFRMEDITADTELFNAHLESMRARGLVTEEMEAELKAGDDAAEALEKEAQAWEAAAICEVGQ